MGCDTCHGDMYGTGKGQELYLNKAEGAGGTCADMILVNPCDGDYGEWWAALPASHLPQAILPALVPCLPHACPTPALHLPHTLQVRAVLLRDVRAR